MSRWRCALPGAAWGVVLALATRRVAAACPACFAASEARVADMYLISAALLSMLPFGIVAAIVWWWRRRQVAGAGG